MSYLAFLYINIAEKHGPMESCHYELRSGRIELASTLRVLSGGTMMDWQHGESHPKFYSMSSHLTLLCSEVTLYG
jgi:hypothetical protein